MPMYDYKCSEDHTTTEWFPTFEDASAEQPCKKEECTSTAKRLIGTILYRDEQMKFKHNIRVKTMVDSKGNVHEAKN
jgi:predicted nucleic acid-binding Zn ribbon protein